MLEKPFNKSPSAKAALLQTTPNSPGLGVVFSHSPFSIDITVLRHPVYQTCTEVWYNTRRWAASAAFLNSLLRFLPL